MKRPAGFFILFGARFSVVRPKERMHRQTSFRTLAQGMFRLGISPSVCEGMVNSRFGRDNRPNGKLSLPAETSKNPYIN